MNLKNLSLTTQQIAGNPDGSGYIVETRKRFLYENGVKTDTQTHVTYDVVFPDNGFEKETIKVAGTAPVIENDDILKQNGKVKARFKNLTGKIYRANNGEYKLTCSADEAEVIK